MNNFFFIHAGFYASIFTALRVNKIEEYYLLSRNGTHLAIWAVA